MFTEPHLSQGKIPPWWDPLNRITGPAFSALSLLGLMLWWWLAPSDAPKRAIHSWEPELAQAEFWRKKGDPYRAIFFYNQAFRLAAVSDDWEGLLVTACGLEKLGRTHGPGTTAHTVLVRTMVAAQRKKSRAGLRSVAKGFSAIGEPTFASIALSRIQESWPEDVADRVAPAKVACWDWADETK